MFGISPSILVAPLAFYLQAWLLLVYAGIGGVVIIVILGALCARDPYAVHRWMRGSRIARKLLPKQNLRGHQVNHNV